MMRGSISSELLMLLWRCAYFDIAFCGYNRCMYMAHVCYYVCCSDCVGMFVVWRPLLRIVGF